MEGREEEADCVGLSGAVERTARVTVTYDQADTLIA